MNGQPILMDALVERMLACRVDRGTSDGLHEAISAQVARTPQVRPRPWARVTVPVTRAPGLRLAWLVLLLGLLLAAVIGAAMVGSRLLEQRNKLAVVPSPSAMPSVLRAGLVTPSAFGPITWHRIDPRDLPDAIDVIGTPSGLVAMTDDGLRWQAADGTWPLVSFEGADLFEPVSVVGDDLLVGGAEPFWLRRNGSRWVVGERIEIDADVDVGDVVVGPHGMVNIDGATVYHSTDGVHFAPAVQPPDSLALSGLVADCLPHAGSHGPVVWDLDPVIATNAGFVAYSPATPADLGSSASCGPVAWFSADGSTWDLVSPISPFGIGPARIKIATRDDRHVAVTDAGGPGDPPPVWVSDDGLTWERLPALRPTTCPGPDPYCGYTLAGLEASTPGWVLLAEDGVAWTSADGRTWQQLIGWPAIRGGWNRQDLALTSQSVYVAYPAYPGDGVVIGTFEP